jgi:hypothetical protein
MTKICFGKKKNKEIKKALLIGINYIGQNGELRGCINDTNNIKVILVKLGFKEKNIMVITDNTIKKPTKHNIIKGIKWLMNNNNKNPTKLFLHYSGHGSYVKDKNNEELDGKDECLVPLDYKQSGMIIDDDIKKMIYPFVKKNTNFIGLIDACHSSTMLDLKYSFEVKQTDNKTTKFDVVSHNYDRAVEGKIMLFSGCEDKQTSADAYINNRFQGAMTYAFTKSLKVNNYDITYEKLLSEIHIIMKNSHFTQRPTFSSDKSIAFEDKFFS